MFEILEHLSYSVRFCVRFCSAAKMSFFSGWGWGFNCSYFFLKCPTIPPFHSKMSFTRKNPEFFLARSDLINLLIIFSGSTLQNIIFLVLTPKGSLFSLYYCYSYYPAYLVWNLFLTTHCDKFCTWKSPTIPSFFTPIIPTFSLLFVNFYRYFFPTFLLKGT